MPLISPIDVTEDRLDEIREMARGQHDTAQGPCVDCPHAARCGPQGLACEQFNLFSKFGGETRWRGAPRQPSREMWTRIFGKQRKSRRQLSDVERRRAREALAIKMRREGAEF